MKYYDESRMAGIRKALEEKIMEWPGVTSKSMMGCLCYLRGRKFFAILVTNGIVIARADPSDRAKLAKMKGSKPFVIGGRTSSRWNQNALKDPRDLTPLWPYIHKSFEAAS